MKLVGGDNADSRVAKFPPKLMADCDYFNRSWRLRRILDGMDDAGGGEKKHQHDERGDHGPGEFHLIAAINLRRLAAIVVSPLAKLRNGVDQQAEYNHKNKSGDRQDQCRQMKD